MSRQDTFAVITITESGAGNAHGVLGHPGGVKAGRYALVPEPIACVIPDPTFPYYQSAVIAGSDTKGG